MTNTFLFSCMRSHSFSLKMDALFVFADVLTFLFISPKTGFSDALPANKKYLYKSALC